MPRIWLAPFALLLVSSPGATEEPPAGSASPQVGARESFRSEPPYESALFAKEIRVVAMVGGFGDGIGGVGISGGGIVLERVAMFEVGVLGQGGVQLLGYNFASGAVLAGPVVQTTVGFRAELLAQLGFDRYSGYGSCAILCSNVGASATRPMVGARLGLGYRFRRAAKVHPEIGLWGVYENNFRRASVRYWNPGDCSSTGCGLFSTPASWETVSVGTYRVSVQLSAGIDFDLR
jgi:hypothetical protein